MFTASSVPDFQCAPTTDAAGRGHGYLGRILATEVNLELFSGAASNACFFPLVLRGGSCNASTKAVVCCAKLRALGEGEQIMSRTSM